MARLLAAFFRLLFFAVFARFAFETFFLPLGLSFFFFPDLPLDFDALDFAMFNLRI
ncbi:MAG: hypothetical protein AB7O50_06950 [Pseudolabrys sp.]